MIAKSKATKPRTTAKSTPKKSSAGRETRLTDCVFLAIVQSIQAGNFLAAAADAAGVGYSTAREWIRRGRGDHPTRKKTPRHAQFAAAIRRAEAKAELMAVSVLQENLRGYETVKIEVTKLADGSKITKTTTTQVRDHRAVTEFLARRYPKRWGLKDQIDHDHKHEHSGQVAILSPEDQAIASRIMSSRLSTRHTRDENLYKN